MAISTQRKSHSRLIIAGSLFLTSIAASFLISFISHSGEHYWVINHPLARGVQISPTDVGEVKASLGPRLSGYLSTSENPIGSITRRALLSGELLNANDITGNAEELNVETLSISIRASDIPISTNSGDLVSLYQVHDARNGEAVIPPERVISGVFIKEVARKSANFGSDLSLTITVNRDDVPTILEATASGRIVVVGSRG